MVYRFQSFQKNTGFRFFSDLRCLETRVQALGFTPHCAFVALCEINPLCPSVGKLGKLDSCKATKGAHETLAFHSILA
jgi:hypothetical protein